MIFFIENKYEIYMYIQGIYISNPVLFLLKKIDKIWGKLPVDILRALTWILWYNQHVSAYTVK